MPHEKLGDLVKDLTPDDIRIDEAGRIVITSPAVAERLKAAAALSPDTLAGRDDTNVICCGNGTCSKKGELGNDLGALVDRFVGGGITRNLK